MKRGQVATEDQKDAVVRDYLSGESVRDIASRHGVSKPTVRSWVRAAGYGTQRRQTDGPGSRGIRWDGVPLGSATDRVIAEQLGCSRQAVSYARRARGIGSASQRMAVELSRRVLGIRVTDAQFRAFERWRGDRSVSEAIRDLIDTLKDEESTP